MLDSTYQVLCENKFALMYGSHVFSVSLLHMEYSGPYYICLCITPLSCHCIALIRADTFPCPVDNHNFEEYYDIIQVSQMSPAVHTEWQNGRLTVGIVPPTHLH